MNPLTDIPVFVSIVEEGGISAAAHRLRLSKSSVSRRLSALEARFGVELIARSTRSQKLTEEGQLLYQRALRILADLQEMEADVAHARQTLSGTLRVTAPLYYGQHHLPVIVLDFMERHPGVTLDLDLSDHHANLIDDGFDLAIRIGRLRDSSLRARKLRSVPIIACASPAYLADTGAPRVPSDLQAHRGLLHRSGTVISEWLYEGGKTGQPARARVGTSLISNNDFLLLQAAKWGRGVICAPEFVVQDALISGELVQVLPDVRWYGVDVHAVYPAARHLPNRVRAFIDLLAERLGESGGGGGAPGTALAT